MNDRQIAAAIARLCNPAHAEKDFNLLVTLKPELKKSPSYSAIAFSPRRNQPTVLKMLLEVATAADIEANRHRQKPKAPVATTSVAASKASKQGEKKKAPSPKKPNTPASSGETSPTPTPAQPS